MIDVTSKRSSLRRATAEAVVTMRPESAAAIREGRVPKGGVVDATRAVALLGIKQTPDLLPFCHRIPVEHGAVEVEVGDDRVTVRVEVAAVARTGVEVEAMTGAAAAALNVYDMIKPIDPTAAIAGVRVLAKRGGKSDWVERFDRPPRAGVLVVSDSVAAGTKSDTAGAAVRERLAAAGVEAANLVVVPDEPGEIASRVTGWCDADRLDLVVAVGGTGLGPRDRTPEAVRPLLDRELPGLAEAVRAYGRERTPLADLSRAVGGQRGTTLVLAVAGSTRGAAEAMDALLPWVLHVLKVFEKGYRHGR